MKLRIEYAGNGQTIIASENGPVAYMAPDLPEAVEESLAAAFAAVPSFLTDLTRIAQLEAEIVTLKHLLSVSEDYRRAYADGKYKLYAMGGEICEAAAIHLPMSEGPLERACRKTLGS